MINIWSTIFQETLIFLLMESSHPVGYTGDFSAGMVKTIRPYERLIKSSIETHISKQENSELN